MVVFSLSGQGKSGVFSGDHEFTLVRRQASDGGRDIAEYNYYNHLFVISLLVAFLFFNCSALSLPKAARLPVVAHDRFLDKNAVWP